MESQTGRWTPAVGWSTPLPPWDGPTTLVLVLAGSELLEQEHPGLLAVLGAYRHSVVVGCSTAGQVFGADVDDEALTVAVVRFATTRLAVQHSAVERDGSREAGLQLGSRLQDEGDDLAAVLVLADGLSVNGSALAEGLAAGTHGKAMIVGGLAGDGTRFERTWVLVDGVPRAGHVTAVGWYGSDVEVGNASSGGWSPLGPERIVTRSEGSLLLELDDRPALELYCTYLGDRASGLPATALLFPLAVRVPGTDGGEVVRTVLGIDTDRQGMVFAGDVPQGATAQLMRGTSERLIEAAQDAASLARLTGDEPALALAVSCVGRRLVLGQRTAEELEAVAEGLGPNTALVGFYSYGELSPLTPGGCDLHNQTMTVTVIRERTR